MTINLYYVHGISNIDTPYFATSTSSASRIAQEDYFDSKLVKSIETAFYPPHYKNEIKFDNEDLDFNTNVNYLSLEFNDKRYYYFIDDIEYVSESVIRVYCTMDVIQTYMFDIEITNGIIERKFINRWVYDNVNWRINRNYIRENVSEGEMYYYTRDVYNGDSSIWVLCIKMTEQYHTSNITLKINYDLQVPGVSYPNSGYEFIFTYLGEWNTRGRRWADTSSATDARATNVSNHDIDMVLAAFSKVAYYCQKNEIADIYICPFNFIEGNTFSGNTLTIAYNDAASPNNKANVVPMIIPYIAPNVNERELFLVPNPKLPADDSHASNEQELKVITEKVTKTFTYTKNNLIGKPFDSDYMPMMLDENYVEFTFGTIASFTTIPLYKLNRASLVCHYAFNVCDGSRIYWITRDSSEQDIFKTMVTDMNVIHWDIKNNAWQQYEAANRGRWYAAIANTAITVFTKGKAAGIKNKFAKEDMNSIISEQSNFDRRYNNPMLKKKAQKEYQGLQRSIEANNSNFINNIIGGNDILGQTFKDTNYVSVPPTPRQSSNATDAIGTGALIIAEEKHVNDYEQVAQYYHRNGYLTNTYINYTDTLFDDVQNRYYFNVLKMSLPEVHLKNVIEDETTIQLIKQRLVDGLRLWNVLNSDNMGDFQYDNVEYDFITQGGN